MLRLPYVLIAAFALLNGLYLLVSPLDLSPDEAHYWDWSRRLDWSYYSKGPIIAWLIRASCELFGTTAVAVRLPAVFCNALTLIAFHQLVRRTLNDRIALAALAFVVVLPPVSAGAILSTIDAPFLCCWSWALLCVHRAVFDGNAWNWTAAGGFVALGTMTKYTMLAFPALVGLYLLLAGQARSGRGFRRMTAIGLLGLLPILHWNATHDWLGVRHLFGQAGLATGPKIGFKPFGPLDYLGGQFAFLAGYWFCAFAAGAWTYRRSRCPQMAFLWWFSVPVVLALVPFSLRVKVQPNWPAAAYLAGFPLAVVWVFDQLRSESRTYRVAAGACLAFGITVCASLSVLTRFPQLALPILAQHAAEPTDDRLAPVRNLDPTARLRGWKHLAAAVDELRERVWREDGEDPRIATMTWTVPGELGFYCAGHPTVHSFGPALSDRFSQYDIWRPNPLADAQDFRGCTFVYVGEKIPEGEEAFDRYDGPFRVEYRENGVTVGGWKLWIARGYRGFRNRDNKPQY